MRMCEVIKLPKVTILLGVYQIIIAGLLQGQVIAQNLMLQSFYGSSAYVFYFAQLYSKN